MIILLLILFFLIILISLNLALNKDNFVSENPTELKLYDIYHNKIQELHDPDYILKRTIKKGNFYTERATGNNVFSDKVFNYYPAKLNKKYTDEELKELEKKYNIQNLFVNDGFLYYESKQFPDQALPIDFAINPHKFIKEHPFLYPSYVIIRNHRVES